MWEVLCLFAVAIAALLYLFLSLDGFEPGTIAGKRVLVTGASSGIGEKLAYHYSELGAKVALVARRVGHLEAVALKCRELGAEQVLVVPADLVNGPDCQRAIEAVQKHFGGLDHLVLNHAVLTFGAWHGTAQNLTTLSAQLDVNFVSHVDLASRALEMLMASKGNLGVVSSIAGKIAFPTATSYCADKFALQGFFLALAQELRHRGTGVSVTVCVIGPVDNSMAHYAMGQKKCYEGYSLYDFRPTASDTAMVILRAVATRQREIHYNWATGLVVTLHSLFPSWMEAALGKFFHDFY